MPSQPKKTRISKPPPRLSLLVDRPGGLPRDVAIARGAEKLESQRASAQGAIRELIGKLEEMIVPPPGLEQLRDLRRITDNLIAVATVFDLAALKEVGTRLSRLLAGFDAVEEVRADAIVVHVNALRLLELPNHGAPLADEILCELDRVLAHFCVRHRSAAALN